MPGSHSAKLMHITHTGNQLQHYVQVIKLSLAYRSLADMVGGWLCTQYLVWSLFCRLKIHAILPYSTYSPSCFELFLLMWIRIGLHTDPDPDADPDPGSKKLHEIKNKKFILEI